MYAGELRIAGNVGDIRVSMPSGLTQSILNGVRSLFGDNSLFVGIFQVFRKWIKSPQQRMFEQVEESLRRWVNDVSIDDVIDACKQQCRETLDRSMTDTCADYEHTCAARDQLQNFVDNRPSMEWRDVTIAELTGGVEYV